jgi:CubicO group peptidase (beta-lactamase class C family)
VREREKEGRICAALRAILLIAAGVSVLGPAPAHAADIPVAGAVYHVVRPDNSSWTYVDVVVGKGFAGRLPADVDAIEVAGPHGALPLVKSDFTYNPSSRDFWAALPGPPALGRYTFTVMVGDAIGSATATQSSLQALPPPDTASLTPAKGATVTCRLPSFSWAAPALVETAYYLLEIEDEENGNVYRSGYVKDMFSVRLPADLLRGGQRYRWRLRLADGSDWVTLDNRSHSRWRRFTFRPVPQSCTYGYRMPDTIDDGWETSALSAERIDSAPITAMIRDILNGKFKDFHSVLLIKNGKLVLEEYFEGYTRNSKHKLASVTKSISSILTGIAIDKNLIPDVNLRIDRLFPEYRGTKWIDGNFEISLRDVLTMTSGLHWLAATSGLPLTDRRNDDSALYRSYDPIRFTLDKDLIAVPGSVYNYSTGLSVVLGEVIRRKSRMSIEAFSRKYLFDPLGITDFQWRIFPNGTVDTGGGFLVRPRDMAKIGYLMLQDGKWNNRPIVSERWVRESTRQHVDQIGVETIAGGYGYQWHVGARKFNQRTTKAFFAAGLGGQYIFVLPDLDLVAVFNSKHPESDGVFNGQWVLGKYILPAVLPPPGLRQVFAQDPDSVAEYPGEYVNDQWPETLVVRQRENRIVFVGADGESAPLVVDSPRTTNHFHAGWHGHRDGSRRPRRFLWFAVR